MSDATQKDAAARERDALSPFIGRDVELQMLGLALERALHGSGQVVLLAGEPGIGKTRTTEQSATHARERGALVLWGNCYEWEGAPAFWPWVQVLRAWVRGRDDATLRAVLGPDATLVAQIVPEIRARLPDLPPPPVLEPDARLFRLLAAVATVVRAAAELEPLLIVLDDIHWADRPSLQLLLFLAQEIRDARVMLIATYRNAELSRQHPATAVLADITREFHCQRILMHGLPKPQVARFMALVTGQLPPAALIDVVFEETDGNPFFVVEVARLLADEGHLVTADPTGFRLNRVPESVREAIGRRVDRLPPACSRALAIGSVIGREFSMHLLERAAVVPAIDLFDALHAAVQAQLVTTEDPPGTYRFGHALVQETLYQELPAAERARLHRSIGAALEEATGDREPPWAELAHHFYHAGPLSEPEKVIHYASGAGDMAMQQYDWESAATHYRRALGALDLIAEAQPLRRCDLLLGLGEAQTRAGPGSGDVPEARATFEQAYLLAAGLGDADRMARAAVGFAGLNIVTAFGGARQMQFLEGALAALPPVDSPLRVRVLSRLAVDLWNRSTDYLERSRALSGEAVDIAGRLGDPGLMAFALWARHFSGWRPDNLEERGRVIARVVALAEQTSDPVIAAWGYVSLTLDCLEADDLAGSERALATIRRFDARARIPYLGLREAVYRGMLELLTGRYAEAAPLVDRARELWKSSTARMHQIQTFILLRDLGRLDELTEEIVLPDEGNLWGVATRAYRMLLTLEREQVDAAKADYEALVAGDMRHIPFDAYWFGVVIPLSRAAITFGDLPRASRLYAMLEPYADRLGFVGILGVCHSPVSLYLGQLATALRRWEDAECWFGQALAHAERLGLRPSIVRALLSEAEMRAERAAPGDVDVARGLARRAVDAATAMGMAGLVPRIEALLDRLSPGRADRFGLTPRELEVLQLVASGLTDIAIADRLFLSRRTVNSHLTSIYTKLGVSSRTAATRIAIEHALI